MREAKDAARLSNRRANNHFNAGGAPDLSVAVTELVAFPPKSDGEDGQVTEQVLVVSKCGRDAALFRYARSPSTPDILTDCGKCLE